MVISSLLVATPAWSRPHDTSHETVVKQPVLNSQNNYSNGLSYTQKNQLIDLLRGSSRDSSLLNPSLRIKIANQIHSLPPGIEKRLARGKGLPSGLAKKVNLPNEINEYLNLSQELKIIVLGSSVVVLDPFNNIILDVLQYIF
ncbi:hypothetical protein Sta7437_2476 [Stanieria cyanosphaera PCC 7437]|uniref:Uncharacterized protein n=2 Tax=Stanieria cyanosphaera TaxID=102116 RepID=K9XVB4_STAC7|nr:hypothetical protein Sta7437_2476 [Stanieria cyanosphaera PCC 7437]